MLMLVAHLWLAAIVTFFSRFDQPGRFIVAVSRISAIMYSIVFTSSIIVTFGYYYLAPTNNLPRAWLAQLGDLHRHFFNTLVTLVDLFLLDRVVNLVDFMYIVFYFCCYIITNTIYWSQNAVNNVVYRQLDFNKPIEAFFFLAIAFISSSVIHFFHFVFAKIHKSSLI
jgi:hypothetical protein